MVDIVTEWNLKTIVFCFAAAEAPVDIVTEWNLKCKRSITECLD